MYFVWRGMALRRGLKIGPNFEDGMNQDRNKNRGLDILGHPKNLYLTNNKKQFH